MRSISSGPSSAPLSPGTLPAQDLCRSVIGATRRSASSILIGWESTPRREAGSATALALPLRAAGRAVFAVVRLVDAAPHGLDLAVRSGRAQAVVEGLAEALARARQQHRLAGVPRRRPAADADTREHGRDREQPEREHELKEAREEHEAGADPDSDDPGDAAQQPDSHRIETALHEPESERE